MAARPDRIDITGQRCGGAIAAAGLLVWLLAPGLAGAQDASPATEDVSDEDDTEMTPGVEDFVVRASRRPINIQEVPDSAIAFDAAELQEARITDIKGLSDYTPNLEIKTGASSVSSPTLFIRGIGLLDFNSNAASSVAIYNDNVYMNSPVGQLFSLYDVEAVEVKRGPQGVLLARNASAGAIRIIPRRPDGEFAANGRFTYGNYDLVEGEGGTSFPILDELLSARVSGRFQMRDGITDNRCDSFYERNPDYHASPPVFPRPDEESCRRNRGTSTPSARNPEIWPIPGGEDEVNDLDNWAARALLRFTPSLEQDWVLNVNGGKTDALAYQFQARGLTNNTNGSYRDTDGDPFAGDYDLVGPENVDLFSTALNGRIEFDDFLLSSTSGYQYSERDAIRNFDAGPFIVAHAYTEDEVWQASQELRLSSDFGGEVEFDSGAYVIYEKLDSFLQLADLVPNRCGPNGSEVLPGVDVDEDTLCKPNQRRPGASFVGAEERDSEQETLSFALYGQTHWELTETLFIDTGIRWNWERKDYEFQLTATPYGNPRNSHPTNEDDDTWSELTGDIVVTWAPTELVSTYAKYTRGFKAGGFNGGVVFNLQGIDSVDPEFVDAFEVGLRSEWFDRRLLFNAAAWYYDYKDYQVFQLSNEAAEGGSGFPLPQLLNAPRLESYGLEFELQTTPVDGMRLDVSVGLLEATFREFAFQRQNAAGARTKNFNGNPLVAAPPVSFVGVWAYDIPLSRFGSLSPRVDAIYTDKTYFSPGVEPTAAELLEAEKNEAASQDAYWLLNARLAYRTPDGRIEVAGWVRNATDEVYLSNAIDLTNGLSTVLDVHGAPRTYGLTVGYSW